VPVNSATDFFAVIIALVAVLGIGAQGETLFRYSLQDETLVIRLFGLLAIRRITLRRVRQVSPVHLRDWISFGDSSKTSYLWCEKWGGWMLFFRGVAITLEGGKTILVAPSERDNFVTLMQSEIGKLGSGPEKPTTEKPKTDVTDLPSA
jgi:hypothetical protein